MNRLILFILLLNVMSCTSCRKETHIGDSGTMSFSLRTVYGDQPFISNQVYDYPSEGAIQFDKLNIFLSDIVLVRGDGQEVSVEDIVLLNIAALQSTMIGAQTGWNQKFKGLPIGDYIGIRFGLGVGQELNSQQPTDFATGSHPLSENANYSLAFYSYIFTSIGGLYHVSGTTTDFSLKILQDQMFRQIQLNKHFSISAEQASIDLEFDLKQVFSREYSILDIQNYPSITQPSSAQMNWLTESLKYSFSL